MTKVVGMLIILGVSLIPIRVLAEDPIASTARRLADAFKNPSLSPYVQLWSGLAYERIRQQNASSTELPPLRVDLLAGAFLNSGERDKMLVVLNAISDGIGAGIPLHLQPTEKLGPGIVNGVMHPDKDIREKAMVIAQRNRQIIEGIPALYDSVERVFGSNTMNRDQAFDLLLEYGSKYNPRYENILMKAMDSGYWSVNPMVRTAILEISAPSTALKNRLLNELHTGKEPIQAAVPLEKWAETDPDLRTDIYDGTKSLAADPKSNPINLKESLMLALTQLPDSDPRKSGLLVGAALRPEADIRNIALEALRAQRGPQVFAHEGYGNIPPGVRQDVINQTKQALVDPRISHDRLTAMLDVFEAVVRPWDSDFGEIMASAATHPKILHSARYFYQLRNPMVDSNQKVVDILAPKVLDTGSIGQEINSIFEFWAADRLSRVIGLAAVKAISDRVAQVLSDSTNSTDRAHALSVLSRFAPYTDGKVLSEALLDPSLRDEAAEALGRVRAFSSHAVGNLLKALTNSKTSDVVTPVLKGFRGDKSGKLNDQLRESVTGILENPNAPENVRINASDIVVAQATPDAYNWLDGHNWHGLLVKMFADSDPAISAKGFQGLLTADRKHHIPLVAKEVALVGLTTREQMPQVLELFQDTVHHYWVQEGVREAVEQYLSAKDLDWKNADHAYDLLNQYGIRFSDKFYEMMYSGLDRVNPDVDKIIIDNLKNQPVLPLSVRMGLAKKAKNSETVQEILKGQKSLEYQVVDELIKQFESSDKPDEVLRFFGALHYNHVIRDGVSQWIVERFLLPSNVKPNTRILALATLGKSNLAPQSLKVREKIARAALLHPDLRSFAQAERMMSNVFPDWIWVENKKTKRAARYPRWTIFKFHCKGMYDAMTQ